MNLELMEALKQLQQEKNIDPGEVIDALEEALVSAYRKNYKVPEESVVRVEVDRESGKIRVFQKDTPDSKEVEQKQEDFGRIAAQTAKQVVLQRLRDVERSAMYEEYHDREGDIITGIVQQSDPRYILISLGKVEALLPPSEQVRSEKYRHGTRLKAYIIEVRKTSKEPQIVVSRSHPGLLKRLFELEVPEIADGFVEINSVSREPGSRSKIAVSSKDENIDAVGACVGPRGSRVRMVVSELWGEKIDIVNYSEDPSTYVANALSPAKVDSVTTNEEERSAEVIVPDDQLSLAIGKEGQNARLAAKLTGWRIDIKSHSQHAEGEEGEVVHPEEEEEKSSQESVVKSQKEEKAEEGQESKETEESQEAKEEEEAKEAKETKEEKAEEPEENKDNEEEKEAEEELEEKPKKSKRKKSKKKEKTEEPEEKIKKEAAKTKDDS